LLTRVFYCSAIYILVINRKVKGKDVLVHARKAKVKSISIHSYHQHKKELSVQTARPGHFIHRGKLRTPIELDAGLASETLSGRLGQKIIPFPCRESNYDPLIVQRASKTCKNIPAPANTIHV